MTAQPPSVWEALQVLQEALEHVGRQKQPPPPGGIPLSETPSVARTIYRHRRARDKHFPEITFGDPMWDVLLDLYASEAEGKRITISSACIAAAVPPTTALRVIKALEEAGSIERYRFGQDARRVHVRLTATARIRLAAYLQMYGVVVPR